LLAKEDSIPLLNIKNIFLDNYNESSKTYNIGILMDEGECNLENLIL